MAGIATPTPAAPATTILVQVMGSITGNVFNKRFVSHYNLNVFSGSSGTQSSGGVPYTTHYNYNTGESSSKSKK